MYSSYAGIRLNHILRYAIKSYKHWEITGGIIKTILRVLLQDLKSALACHL